MTAFWGINPDVEASPLLGWFWIFGRWHLISDESPLTGQDDLILLIAVVSPHSRSPRPLIL